MVEDAPMQALSEAEQLASYRRIRELLTRNIRLQLIRQEARLMVLPRRKLLYWALDAT
jgi:hypothetical protein